MKLEKFVETHEKNLEFLQHEKRAYYTGMRKRFCHVLKLLPPNSPKLKVLDLGLGQGWLTYFIKKWCNCKVYGLDICPLRRRHLEEERIQVKKCDVEKERIPFEDGFFDFVVCAEVLEHLSSPLHALDEIKRIMRRGGTLILTTPNAKRLAVRLKSYVGRMGGKSFATFFEKILPPSQQHEKEYTMEELKHLLGHHGFRIKRAFYVNFTSPFSILASIYLVATSFFPAFREDLVIEAQVV